MHNRYSLECIVIKRSNVGDADKIITIFSRKLGKLRVIAKGIRKIKSRRAPHLELFNKTTLHLHKGKNLDIITEAQSIQTYETMKKDLQKISIGYLFIELIDKLCPELVEQDEVYVLLSKAIEALNSPKQYNQSVLKDRFGNRLLHLLGFLPYDQTLQGKSQTDFIESLIEGKLKTQDILTT